MRLIDADALQREYMQYHDGKRIILVDLAPTIDPERKTGKWIPTQNPQWKAYYHDKCSVCGWWNTKNAVCRDSNKKARSLNYCPNCGSYNGGDDNA